MKWAIVVNPLSGKRNALALAHEFRDQAHALGVETSWICGSSADQSTEQLQDVIAAGELHGVVVVGGDGLVNLAIQALALTSIPMSVIAAGTGNDFARSSGTFGMSPTAICQLMHSQLPEQIDLGRVQVGSKSKWFGQILSTGFDSVVNERANTFKKLRGKMKYNIATILELPKFSPKEYVLTLDEGSITTRAMLVAVANGATYGGGMKVCPQANRNDGLFDVLILRPLPKWEFMAVFPKVFKGTHITHPKVEILRTRTITISSDAMVFADGEHFGGLPISMETVPRALFTWTCK